MATYKILCVLLPCVVTFTSFATVSGDDSLLVYENAERRGFHASDARFSHDSAYLLVAGWRNGRTEQQELRVWSLDRQEFVAEHRLNAAGQILRVDIAPDGETVLLGTSEYHEQGYCSIDLYRWDRGRLDQNRLMSALTPLRQLASAIHNDDGTGPSIWGKALFSPSGSRCAIDRRESYPNSHTVIGIIEPSGEVVSMLRPEGYIKGMAFLNDDTLALTSLTPVRSEPDSLEIEMTLWDASGGEQLAEAFLIDLREEARLYGESHCLASLVATADGSFLASDGVNYAVQIWTVDPLETHRELTGLTNQVWCAEFHPERNILAAASLTDGELYLWDWTTGEVLWNLDNASSEGQARIRSLHFSPNGEWLVTSGWDSTPGRSEVRLWNVAQLLEEATPH